jgi:hypothetical protein
MVLSVILPLFDAKSVTATDKIYGCTGARVEKYCYLYIYFCNYTVYIRN